MSGTGAEMSYRLFAVITLGLSLLLGGCAVKLGKSTEKVYWPKPPEAPRYVHEANIHNELDIERVSRSEALRRKVIGSDPKAKAAFIKPFDVAVRHGRIVVSDTMANTLHLFDIPSRRLMRIGRSKVGRLLNPLGVAIDDEANIYVADSGAKQVVVYNATGHFLKRIGGSGDLVRPADVAVTLDGSRLYVVDAGGITSDRHRVAMYSGEGELLRTFGIRGQGEGEFNLPVSLAVAPDGNVYVLDSGNFRVQVFDADGNFIRAWGQLGRGYGDFARPRGIAIDADGYVYVTDAAYRNFQIFTPEGQLLMWVGGDTMHDEPGGYVLPSGIAVDETFRVYVVDQLFRKVDVIRRLTEKEIRTLTRNLQRRGRRPAAAAVDEGEAREEVADSRALDAGVVGEAIKKGAGDAMETPAAGEPQVEDEANKGVPAKVD